MLDARLGVVSALLLAFASNGQDASPPKIPENLPPWLVPMDNGYVPTAMEALRKEARGVMGLVRHHEAQRFLVGTSWLPVDVARVIYKRKDPRGVVSQAAFEAMPEAERAGYERVEVDDYTYYYTRYGSPVAYARAIDLICVHLAGVGVEPGSPPDLRGTPLRGKRILDFGYGSIGQLRLLAGIGCDVTGVDVDPTLAAIYSAAEDQGEIEGTGLSENKPPAGRLKLVCGSWPGDPAVAQAVGGGFDVILSKNTLKNGYINPEREVDQRMLVNLGVERKDFVEKLAAALNPGGIVMIYNICPRPKGPDEPYMPWADGRCPFPREEVAAAGLEVVAFDEDDTAGMRPFAVKLGWDLGSNGMDLENDFVVTYTLLRKP